MLRKILGCPRQLQMNGGVEETWVEWIVRATSKAEKETKSLNIMGWVEAQQARKEQLANKIRSCTDERWTKRLLMWGPRGGFRRVGRPCTRWTDAWLDETAMIQRSRSSEGLEPKARISVRVNASLLFFSLIV